MWKSTFNIHLFPDLLLFSSLQAGPPSAEGKSKLISFISTRNESYILSMFSKNSVSTTSDQMSLLLSSLLQWVIVHQKSRKLLIKSWLAWQLSDQANQWNLHVRNHWIAVIFSFKKMKWWVAKNRSEEIVCLKHVPLSLQRIIFSGTLTTQPSGASITTATSGWLSASPETTTSTPGWPSPRETLSAPWPAR